MCFSSIDCRLIPKIYNFSCPSKNSITWASDGMEFCMAFRMEFGLIFCMKFGGLKFSMGFSMDVALNSVWDLVWD